MAHPSFEEVRNALTIAGGAFGLLSKGYELVQRRKGRREREAGDEGDALAIRDDHSDRIIARLERECGRLAKGKETAERRADREAERAEYYAGQLKLRESQLRRRSEQDHDARGGDPP